VRERRGFGAGRVEQQPPHAGRRELRGELGGPCVGARAPDVGMRRGERGLHRLHQRVEIGGERARCAA
jgi:hypothetical protein